MLKLWGASWMLLIVVLSGCSVFFRGDTTARVHDIHLNDQNAIRPVELYAAVGEEIRWHNGLSRPVYLGFLGVQSVQAVGCDRGFKTWYGELKDIVMIPVGEYVSLCFLQSRTNRYNIWTDLSDPVRSMSPTAVIHLDEVAS